MEGWLSPVEGTRLEIERTVKRSVGSNPTPSALFLCNAHKYRGLRMYRAFSCDPTNVRQNPPKPAKSVNKVST